MWRNARPVKQPGDEAGLSRLMGENFKALADHQRIEADPLLSLGVSLGAEIQFNSPAPRTLKPAMIDQTPQPDAPTVEWPAELSRPDGIAADIELLRLAVGLKLAALARLWLIMLQVSRETNINYLSRADLPALLHKHDVKFSKSNLNRWIFQGNTLFWQIDAKTGRVFPAGFNRLSERLTERAYQFNLPDLIETNSPGQRKAMYVTVTSQNLIEFETNIYLAWHASKNNPTIARSTLSALWNRDARAIRAWEQCAGSRLQIVPNFVHFTPDHADAVPQDDDGNLREDVIPYSTRQGAARWQAQMANTYHVTASIRQHDKRGQARRVSRDVRELRQSLEPAGNCEQGASDQDAPGGLQPTGRRYFSEHKRAQQSAKKSGDYAKPRYIALGADDGNRYQWDYSPDGRQRADFWDCPSNARKERVYA